MIIVIRTMCSMKYYSGKFSLNSLYFSIEEVLVLGPDWCRVFELGSHKRAEEKFVTVYVGERIG